MKELLDKMKRDRWVEILTEIASDYQDGSSTYADVLDEVINYLKEKPTV